MNKNVYNLIEKELYSYPYNKLKIKIESLSSVFLFEVQRRINAIEEAINITLLSSAGKDRYKAISLKYFDAKRTDEGIWNDIPCSRATFFRWKKSFIDLVAELLGWG